MRIIQRLVISKRNPQHVASPSKCRRRPLQKGFLSAGKLQRAKHRRPSLPFPSFLSRQPKPRPGIFCHWHRRRRETAEQRWARTDRPKKWKRPTCQFQSWSSKSQEAKMMRDVLQPTEIAFRRSSSVAHASLREPGSWLKCLGQQSRSPLLDLYSSISLSRLRSMTQLAAWNGAKKYRRRSRKKVSGRRFKTRSVGLVEAETFFCLALTRNFSDVPSITWYRGLTVYCSTVKGTLADKNWSEIVKDSVLEI